MKNFLPVESVSADMVGPTSLDGPSHKIIIREGSKRLLVFFSGTSKSNGRFDFWSSASAQSEHILFLNNGINAWYQNDIPEFSTDVDDTAVKIKQWADALGCDEIVTFGVSMGGYAAILFATILNARALALGFDSVLRHPLSRSAGRMPKRIPVIHKHLRPLIESSDAKITAITGDMDFSDLLSLSRIVDLPNVRSMTLRGVGHGVGRHVNKFYGLSDVMRNFVEKNELPDFKERGVAHNEKVLAKLIFQSHQHFEEKDFHGAISFAGKALKLSPFSEPANFLSGMAFLEIGQGLEAVRHLSIVHGLIPYFSTAKYHLARAMLMIGLTDQAAQHFREYLEIRKDSAGAHFNLAVIQEMRGELDDAIRLALRASELDPTRTNYKQKVNVLRKINRAHE